MNRQAVYVGSLAHGSQPIPNAARIGPLIWSGGVSGATESGQVPGDIRAEAQQMFENIGLIVRAAGAQLSDIVRVSIGVRDRAATADAINQAWASTFPDPATRPARKTSIESLRSGITMQAEFVAYAVESASGDGC